MNKKSKKYSLLIIDDEEALRYSLKRALSGSAFDIYEADSGESGIELAKSKKPNIILLDNRMKGMTGIEALQYIKGLHPGSKIIVMTAFSTTQTTIEAMKFGAFDYIMKPFDVKDILKLIDSAVNVIEGSNQSNNAVKEKPSEDNVDYEIIGNSLIMQNIYKVVGQVSASDVTVLITGDSGTGKELIARAIHKNSLRSTSPFIAVNCSAIPENLIESELFGHEKGSFTGATMQRIGYFEQCDKGTIFLDEIGDMPSAIQTKILRTLQEGEIQRVGSTDTIKIDVRIIAATNKDMELMIKEKKFREDLYYRLNVIRIELPPLRDRKEDIPLLINFIIKKLEKRDKSLSLNFSKETLKILINYDWPGNIRELENVIHRSSVLAQGDLVLPKDLPTNISKN